MIKVRRHKQDFAGPSRTGAETNATATKPTLRRGLVAHRQVLEPAQ
jgi:hypothetical protein